MTFVSQQQSTACELLSTVVSSFGSGRLQVTGSSMLPAIWPGECIEVRRCQLQDLQPGEIALFHQGKKLIAHRVIKVEKGSFFTRGDSLPNKDPEVQEEYLIGKVASVFRGETWVELKRTTWLSACAFLLRRSDLCTRATLSIGLRLRRSGAAV